MEIRPAQIADLKGLPEIDGTVDSTLYLHLDRSGEGTAIQFKLEERPLRTRLIEPNPMDDQQHFAIKQVISGIEEGVALVAEHERELVAVAVAQTQAASRTLELVDLRVDYDFRRQGIGSALIFQLIAAARQQQARAVSAKAKANNQPAQQFLAKSGFELAGLDTHFASNHDLVKEAVTLFWYAALE